MPADEEDKYIIAQASEPLDKNSKFVNDERKKSVTQKDNYQDYDYTEYNSLLSSSKKVMAFVGTSKNGTSFIVNNIAKILADSGIDTAILDTTRK